MPKKNAQTNQVLVDTLADLARQCGIADALCEALSGDAGNAADETKTHASRQRDGAAKERMREFAPQLLEILQGLDPRKVGSPGGPPYVEASEERKERENMAAAMGIAPAVLPAPRRLSDGRFEVPTLKPSDVRKRFATR